MASKRKLSKEVINKSGTTHKHVDPALLSVADKSSSASQSNALNVISDKKLKKAKMNAEETAGQLLSSENHPSVKFVGNEENLNTSDFKVNLYNQNNIYDVNAHIASSASNDASNKDHRWQKYVWYTGAGLGLIGAGVALANSGGGSDPAPAPAPQIGFDNFSDFCASGSFLSPTVINLNTNGSYNYTIDNGFSRPENFNTYNFANLDYIDGNLNVGASGLSVNLNTHIADAYINVSAYASDSSEVIWMREVSVNSTTNNTQSANAYVYASAYANYSGDAEVGICDLSINLTSENAAGAAYIRAEAKYGAEATTIVHDVNVDVHTSGSSYAAESFGYYYLANGAYLGGLNAEAQYGSEANTLLKEITISHESSSDEAAQALIGSTGFDNNSSFVALASFGSTADLEITEGISINATNSGDGDAFASAFSVDLFDDNGYDQAALAAAAILSSSANVTITGNIDVNAITEGSGLARATFAQNDGIYYETSFTGYGGVNSVNTYTGGAYSFYAGVQAYAVGEDYSNAAAEAHVSIDNINVEATALLDQAQAYFVSGNSEGVIDGGIIASAYGSEAESTVEIGEINLTASAKGDASAGFVKSEYDAYRAMLEIKSSVSQSGYFNSVEWSAYDSTATVNIGDISVQAESTARGSLAEAFLVGGALNNTIEVSAYIKHDSEHNTSTVDIGDISVAADVTRWDSTAKAFGVGNAVLNLSNLAQNEGPEARFNVHVSNNASNNAASITIGNLDFEANAVNTVNSNFNNAHSSYAVAFVAGDLSAYVNDFDYNGSTSYVWYQNAELNINDDTWGQGTAQISVGDINVSASTNGSNSNSIAYVAGSSYASINQHIQNSSFNDVYDELYVGSHSLVNFEVDSSHDSSASVVIGNIDVTANAAGNISSALAFMSGQVDVAADLVVENYNGNIQISSENAGFTAFTNTTYAYSEATADVEININASAEDYSSSTVEVGNINIRASSEGLIRENNAEAFMAGHAFASADAWAYGSISVVGIDPFGPATNPDFASAYADITARAHAIASINVSVSADSSNYATAIAKVGDISIESHAGVNGDSLAYMAGFAEATAHAYADSDTYASGAIIGNNTGHQDREYEYTRTYVNVDFTADASDYSDAIVEIGNININATSDGGYGHVDAFLAGYGEDVDVTISASASWYANASVSMKDIDIHATKVTGHGDVNAFVAGQSDNLGFDMGYQSNSAYFNITATATDFSTATINIGDIDVTAHANLGDASAALVLNNYDGYSELYGLFKSSFLNISAYATESADATVTINSINVDAHSDEYDAVAALAYSINGNVAVELSAFATAEDGTNAFAELNITEGININADATKGDASAFMAYGIDGLYRGWEHGHDDQYRRGSFISAYATEYATATVNIGAIDITANSDLLSAQAGFVAPGGDDDNSFTIRAFTDTFYEYHHDREFSDMGAKATINIESINVEATANTDAFASAPTISAYAQDGGISAVEIGNITVNADGNSRNNAFINRISAQASNYADAHVHIGDINISAGNMLAASAYAAATLAVTASWYSNASMQIGDINISAETAGNHGYSNANLQIYANASNYSNATFIAGDINVSGTGAMIADNYIGLTMYANEHDWGAVSSINVGDITLTAETTTSLYPDIHMNIYADTDYSQLSTIHTGNINVNVEGSGPNTAWVNIGDANNYYDQVTIGNFNGYVENVNSNLDIDTNRITWDQDRVATFSGLGSVNLNMDDQVNDDYQSDFQFAFGKIDITGLEGAFHLNLGNDWNDRDVYIPEVNDFTFEESIGTPTLVPNTTIYGYDISGGSSISFNNSYAYNWQFYDLNNGLSPETDVNDLWASISNAFDNADDYWYSWGGGSEDREDNVYVYNVFDETGGGGEGAIRTDLNGDGIYSSRLGVLAYDQEVSTGWWDEGSSGDGSLTALVFLNDINGTLTAESISGIGIG